KPRNIVGNIINERIKLAVINVISSILIEFSS
ncbi:MAG: hypothetical protein ACI86M_003896, partial [Saprospiraceae bacterium]